MMQGFETPVPGRAALARRVGLGAAWLLSLALAVPLFVQSLEQSTVAAVAFGAAVACLVLLPPIAHRRQGRIGLDTPEWGEYDDIPRAIANRG